MLAKRNGVWYISRRPAVSRRCDQSACAVMQTVHRVEKMRHMRRAGIEGLYRRLIITGRVAQRNGAFLRDLTDESHCARKFRRDRDEFHKPPALLLKAAEHRRVRRLKIICILRPSFLITEEGAFQMDACDLRPVRGTAEIPDRRYRFLKHRLR